MMFNQVIAAQHARDTEQLLDIFPVEMWEIILAHLEDSADLFNAWQSSNLLRDLLNPQRHFFLFPEVWNILGIKYERSNDLSYRQDDITKNADRGWHDITEDPVHCRTCGNRRRTQWFSGILSLCLVCKSWSQAISNFYQNLPHAFQRETHSKLGIGLLCHWTKTFFLEPVPNGPSSFLQHFQQTHEVDGVHRSPFLSNMITVVYGFGRNVRTEGHLQQLIDGLYELTQRYGSHVRTLHLAECGGISNTVNNYTIIRNMLQRLPNLEELHIFEGSKTKIPENVNRLIATAIVSRPLPTISGLQFLSTSKLTDSIFGEIIRLNSHISKLEVCFGSVRSIGFLFEKNLPNLRELSIEFNQDGVGFDYLENSQMNWPLTKLCLNFDHRNITDWTRVFEVVGKWKDTVTDLILFMPRNVHKSNIRCADLQFQMGRIKNLKVVLPTFYPLDFILSITDSLKFLEVRVPRFGDNGEGKSLSVEAEMDSKIKLLSCSNQSLDSNVWTFCPKLRQIDLYEVLENGIYDDKNFKIWSNMRWDWEMARYL